MTIDTSVLDSYRDFMEEEADAFVQEILAEFYDNARSLLEVLTAAPDEASLDEFVRAAHTLKSISATVGATELSNLAASLEQKGKEKTLGEISPLLPTLRVTYEKAEIELKKIYS